MLVGFEKQADAFDRVFQSRCPPGHRGTGESQDIGGTTSSLFFHPLIPGQALGKVRGSLCQHPCGPHAAQTPIRSRSFKDFFPDRARLLGFSQSVKPRAFGVVGDVTREIRSERTLHQLQRHIGLGFEFHQPHVEDAPQHFLSDGFVVLHTCLDFRLCHTCRTPQVLQLFHLQRDLDLQRYFLVATGPRGFPSSEFREATQVGKRRHPERGLWLIEDRVRKKRTTGRGGDGAGNPGSEAGNNAKVHGEKCQAIRDVFPALLNHPIGIFFPGSSHGQTSARRMKCSPSPRRSTR